MKVFLIAALMSAALPVAANASLVSLDFGASDGSSAFGTLSYDNTEAPYSDYVSDGQAQAQYDGSLFYSKDGVAATYDVLINTFGNNSASQTDTIVALNNTHYTSLLLELDLSPMTLADGHLPTTTAGLYGTGDVEYSDERDFSSTYYIPVAFAPGAGAGGVSAVPESATWLMMILGFGAIGGIMRRAHRKLEESFTRKVRSLATT